MDKIYLLKLLNQFHEADGITINGEIDNCFLEWLKDYQKVLLHFKDYYEFLGLSIDGWESYELGKGKLDSIILDKSHSISLYSTPKSELFILDNNPLKISREGIEQIEGSDLFYTYNPYTIQDIENIKKLSQIGELISISVCGKNFDKDKQTKIKQLTEQFSSLDIKVNYEESGDNYFYTLYTPRKVKQKRLIR